MSSEPASRAPSGDLRLLIADDYEVVRQGIRALLEAEPGWTVCGEAENGRDALNKAKQLQPDLAILDVSMPGLNGIEACRQIRSEVPGCDVVVLTFYESEQVVHDLLHAGARGYVLKTDAGKMLVDAVRTVKNGGTHLTPTVESMVLSGYLDRGKRQEPNEPAHVLSPREREVVQLLAEGHGNKEVADQLGISLRTVETHRANVMRKLNLHSVSDLVRYAIRNSLVSA